MIDKTQIEELKSRFDLLAYIERHTELRNVATGEWAGPCPRCGGRDRFHVKGNEWFCGTCTGRKFQDAIAAVRLIESCSFPDAVARMAGHAFILPTEQRRPVASAKKARPADWAAKAGAALATAQEVLYSEKDIRGAEYLAKRGLTPATWRRFGLGYNPETNLPRSFDHDARHRSADPQPAIWIPWYAGGHLTGIRYRFLTEHTYINVLGDSQTAKMGSRYQSDFGGLFGGQALARACESKRTLIVCEGEFNALSICQSAGETAVDVLSLGTESKSLTPKMVDYMTQFRHVLLWVDRPKIVDDLMADLPSAYGVSSDTLTGTKQDANDLLCVGDLGGYLTAFRFRMCKTKEERDALYFDLWDAAQFGAELDAGTLQVMGRIAP